MHKITLESNGTLYQGDDAALASEYFQIYRDFVKQEDSPVYSKSLRWFLYEKLFEAVIF